MKYILTAVFETKNEDDAMFALQHVADNLSEMFGEQLQISHVQAVENEDTRPSLRAVQAIRAEDVASPWPASREDDAAVDQLLAKGRANILANIFRHIVNSKPPRNRQRWNEQHKEWVAALETVQNLKVLS
jgi:hypothetical protein